MNKRHENSLKKFLSTYQKRLVKMKKAIKLVDQTSEELKTPLKVKKFLVLKNYRKYLRKRTMERIPFI